MAKRTIVSSLLAVIKKTAGAKLGRVEGEKHAKVLWRYKGRKLMTVCPRTASDRRAEKNAVAFMRRQIREIDNA